MVVAQQKGDGIGTSGLMNQLSNSVLMRRESDKMVEVRERYPLRPIEQFNGKAIALFGQRAGSFLRLHLQPAGHQAHRILRDDANMHLSA